MDRRHSYNLKNRLEQAADEGMAFISWAEAYRWYSMDRIGVNIFRDIEERWAEMHEKGEPAGAEPQIPPTLQRIDNKGGFFILARSPVAIDAPVSKGQ